METELWPLLYRQCHRRQIPISIINGRLSARTLHSNNWVRTRYRQALAQVDHVLCRTAADRQAFIQLGMDQQGCEILGNLKFAQPLTTSTGPLAELADRPYVLAASTHDDEEWQLSKIWAGMSKHPQLLVIAPRHPQRARAILEQLRPLHIKIAQRSRADSVTDATDVYLADTLGELGALIAGAELVFIGGSLIPRGGQNLLEPAAQGKPIIVGPHMENFAAETALLLSRQACIQVDSSDQLASSLVELLADPEQQRRLGDQAKKVMQEQARVAETYLHSIDRYYGPLLEDEAAA
jgi:3-deoxy-D-manno-octulosonic-acid transferase